MKKIFTAAAIALLFAGCTSTEKANEDPYPQEAEEAFIESCVESAQRTRSGDERAVREDCRCIATRLEERLPYAREGANNDFKDADQLARDGKPLPAGLQDDLDAATADCLSER